jgi:hypothetical protein
LVLHKPHNKNSNNAKEKENLAHREEEGILQGMQSYRESYRGA